ncbi:hypothetical protein [Shimia sp.]|uniref:hypothetical protein n=1 Tax=Shimia sp. TaxID=1954381 RepID=UPI003BA9BF7A
MLVAGISVAALVTGILLPLRWGVYGFVGGAAVLFLMQVGINSAGGFAGASFEESLLLFNGSYLSYFGFNLQISYRAFAAPLLALALPIIYRLSLRRN